MAAHRPLSSDLPVQLGAIQKAHFLNQFFRDNNFEGERNDSSFDRDSGVCGRLIRTRQASQNQAAPCRFFHNKIRPHRSSIKRKQLLFL
jgi:hypothetical protein